MTWLGMFLVLSERLHLPFPGQLLRWKKNTIIFGVYILGVVTAFGGGALRNLLNWCSNSVFWDQEFFFIVATVLITVHFFFSK